MGAKDSKPSFISYDDAVKRVSESELRRIREAFKRCAGANGTTLSADAFIHDVLCDGVPTEVADWLYNACGGTRRGIAFRELLCGLVVLTKGTTEEKIKFLWTLYVNTQNDSTAYIYKWDFVKALQLECWSTSCSNLRTVDILTSLFGPNGDRVGYDQFRSWLLIHKSATVLSRWLLADPCVKLTSDLETPSFYQCLAGVTHLEERDIMELEKCFWALRSAAPSGQLDAECLLPLLSPPLPQAALAGTFLAFDENRDGHVDFKELCCGLSAACRGPRIERLKFCFKMFDVDRDGVLNQLELRHMVDTLTHVANESLRNQNMSRSSTPNADNLDEDQEKMFEAQHVVDNLYDNLSKTRRFGKEPPKPLMRLGSTIINQDERMDYINDSFVENYNVSDKAWNGTGTNEEENGAESEFPLSQEDFLIWSVESAEALVTPFLDLIFEVCHIVLGLRPQCKHQERDIVLGWLWREVQRGYAVGQFWYLISAEWWSAWSGYTQPGGADACCGTYRSGGPANGAGRSVVPVDEAIVCDESFTSNSTESMGSLLFRADTVSVGSAASSSGVSSGLSGARSPTLRHPGPINNARLLASNPYKVRTLTGEGGHLARDRAIVQHQDFELVPDALWRALAQWYGGPQPLPRQVVRPPNSDVELELYPLTLKLLRHVPSSQHANTTSWSGMVGGYGAAALSSVGATAATSPRPSFPPERQLAYTAAFSRLATVKQVSDFLCSALGLAREDVRLWQMSEMGSGGTLLEDETPTLAQLSFVDGQRLLVEVRNRDLTWPEEIGALSVTSSCSERRGTLGVPSLPGATGLHNLGNTCFMNAALQAVWNTGPLTRYFNSGTHLYEVNSENPLGTRGALAQRYGELCKEVWSSQMRSVAPLHVRVCVQRHAPHLAGGGQHDAQEMLAWLLDCLHEDLNRVRGPQPVERELKDSDGRPDQVVAAEAWAQHANRNASVITDLFYGQLKSRVRCVTCGKESVRFDAFNMLSLPLPMESYTHCEVKVMLLDGSVPVKYGVRVNSEGHYRDLKSQLSQLCGLPPAAMLLVQAGGPWMGRLLEDGARVRPAKAAELVVYELPRDVDRLEEEDEMNGSVCNGCGEDGVCERQKEDWIVDEKQTPGRPSVWQEVSRTPHTPPSSLCMPALFCFQRSKSDSKMCQSPTTPRSTFYTNKLGREITVRTNPAAIEHHDSSDQERSDADELGSISSYTVQPSKENDIRHSPTLSVKSLNINHDSPHLKRMKFGSSPSNMNLMGETPSVGSEPLHRYNFLVAVHRKQSRQDTYFLSQHKSRPALFGVPLLVPLKEGITSREIYICVWNQVSRFLSAQPPTPPDQSNHATDCDDSLGYTFPFTLRAVRGGSASVCAVCPWPRFCRGCLLPCSDAPFVRNLCPRVLESSSIKINSKRDLELTRNPCNPANSPLAKAKLNRGISARDNEDGENQMVLVCTETEIESLDFNELRHLLTDSNREESNGLPDLMLAIDWDPTALHLRYQSTREKACLEDPSVEAIRLERARPVGLPHCLKAFTADERLEQPYHCAGCRSSQPATKKLQIWRLPPVLIIHLKRFQYVNNKWIKSQKVVNFPFHDFDPTAYLASVPQETILRHHDLRSLRRRKSSGFNFDVRISESDDGDDDSDVEGGEGKDCDGRVGGRLSSDISEDKRAGTTVKSQFHLTTRSAPCRTTETKPSIQRAPEDGRERRHKQSRRERLESTSLVTTPVLDDDLVDYHQHKLREGQDPFDLKYRLYAVVSHSGQMSGGHYVAYARNPSGAWYCYNDSSCRELTTAPRDQELHPVPPIDPSSAYLLFYQRHGLDYDPYLPDITGRQPVVTQGQFAENDGDDLKKMCVLC